jgi:hypothetical protein
MRADVTVFDRALGIVTTDVDGVRAYPADGT